MGVTSLDTEVVHEGRKTERAQTHVKTFSLIPEHLPVQKAQGLELRVPSPTEGFISGMQSLMT